MAVHEEYLKNQWTGEVALIKSNDPHLFQQRRVNKLALWEKQRQSQIKQLTKENGLKKAQELTDEAQRGFQKLNSILKHTLDINDRLDWESLKDKNKMYPFISSYTIPSKDSFFQFVPKKNFFELFFKSMKLNREKLEIEAQQQFEEQILLYENNLSSEKSQYEEVKKNYLSAQSKYNEEIDRIRFEYENGNSKAVELYLEYVYSKSQYPESVSLNYEIIHIADRRTIIVNVDLPSPDSLPNVIEYKYNATKNEMTIKEMKKTDFSKMYEEVVSQIAIRTIHEGFESLYINIADFIVFNGFVDSLDRKTGNPFRACILSIQAEKDYFNSLKLNMITPKDCIFGLKGVVASEFINLAPVKPILNLNRVDKRIIESDEVIDGIDPSNNLAEMDWQKFEILVRDLFSKEFSGDGVDVRVTQASRDAGVDAIIFDPEPIKGGKFVIQAKRYNNVVGVNAVRDLYGTMMNEGAVKGILVTTSTYGKDSYDFANNKPLTLLNGAELIHMFNKHGYDVTINTRKK